LQLLRSSACRLRFVYAKSDRRWQYGGRGGRGLAEQIGKAYQGEEYQEEQREQDERNALRDARDVGQAKGARDQ
jgi:hypothetical protein